MQLSKLDDIMKNNAMLDLEIKKSTLKSSTKI